MEQQERPQGKLTQLGKLLRIRGDRGRRLVGAVASPPCAVGTRVWVGVLRNGTGRGPLSSPGCWNTPSSPPFSFWSPVSGRGEALSGRGSCRLSPPAEERWPLTRCRRARLVADNGVSAPGRACSHHGGVVHGGGAAFGAPIPSWQPRGAGGSELGPSGDTQPLAKARGAGASWRALSRSAAPAEPALPFDLHLFEWDFQSILKPQHEARCFCPAACRALSPHPCSERKNCPPVHPPNS